MTIFTARPGRPVLYMQSPFTAELAPSLAVRQARAFSPLLWLGLLMTGPDSDGYGATELDHGDYLRQAVDVVNRSASHVTVPQPVLFEVHSCPLVRGLALFNSDGVLEAYGALRSATAGPYPPSRFEFKSHQILIKRPDR